MLSTRKVIKEPLILPPFFQSAITAPLHPRLLGSYLPSPLNELYLSTNEAVMGQLS